MISSCCRSVQWQRTKNTEAWLSRQHGYRRQKADVCVHSHTRTHSLTPCQWLLCLAWGYSICGGPWQCYTVVIGGDGEDDVQGYGLWRRDVTQRRQTHKDTQHHCVCAACYSHQRSLHTCGACQITQSKSFVLFCSFEVRHLLIEWWMLLKSQQLFSLTPHLKWCQAVQIICDSVFGIRFLKSVQRPR